MKILIRVKGSAYSGNYDHAGIPGHQGGSAPNFKPIYYRTEMDAFREGSGFGKPSWFLTSEQQKVFDYYHTDAGSTDINRGLREGLPMSEKDSKSVEVLDQITQKNTVPFNVVLYRGLSGSQRVAQQFGSLKGKVLLDKGFASTTSSLTTANYYSGHDWSGNKTTGVRMEIRVRKGTKFYFADTGEKEFLLPRGSRFRVLEENLEERTMVVELL